MVFDQGVLPGHLGHGNELEFVCSYRCLKPNRRRSASPLR
ncbi:hypothetical protein SZ55_0362 [Pseudomonas sp. FeS53a]|nr:hypothetical protein SZ55_0362 [Pseudomonas sp. FeS53a]